MIPPSSTETKLALVPQVVYESVGVSSLVILSDFHHSTLIFTLSVCQGMYLKLSLIRRTISTIPILEISFGPPTVDFGSIWSSKKSRNFPFWSQFTKLFWYFGWARSKFQFNMNIPFLSSFCFLNFVYPPSCLVPSASSAIQFFVLPNDVGPPTTVAAVLNFKNRGLRYHLFIKDLFLDHLFVKTLF